MDSDNFLSFVQSLRDACTDDIFAPPMVTNQMLIEAADVITFLLHEQSMLEVHVSLWMAQAREYEARALKAERVNRRAFN